MKNKQNMQGGAKAKQGVQKVETKRPRLQKAQMELRPCPSASRSRAFFASTCNSLSFAQKQKHAT